MFYFPQADAQGGRGLVLGADGFVRLPRQPDALHDQTGTAKLGGGVLEITNISGSSAETS